ncbi:hypothetical protein EPICR_30081 [Candidatus Desulfarcum epimagneticum]|uniref:Uncharacterized protein n=1 Tax=uncultured Desulfobacteraceae bacterium TaxID=218296 RepID=A0A484HFV9_9BACT|nr:hypothetical protein EPICR_30081 [uncultured Desulfobacteraceae bacterium]
MVYIEPMRFFLYMRDDIMLGHHLDLLNDGGISYFFPEIKGKKENEFFKFLRAVK